MRNVETEKKLTKTIENSEYLLATQNAETTRMSHFTLNVDERASHSSYY